MSNKPDKLYQHRLNSRVSFKFDERVASVFSDMIARSVPGYSQILELIPTLVRQFSQPGLAYYDLGCSLGAGMVAMARALEGAQASIIGVDSSAAMLNQAQPILDQYSSVHDVGFELQRADICDIKLTPAAMVLMNFTLQFIALDKRESLVSKIYSALAQGGVFVLSEKISFVDRATDDVLTNMHHQYKADRGYSKLEISQKRDAIENVLIPETLDRHTARLQDAGFSLVTPWAQNMQFISILAIK